MSDKLLTMDCVMFLLFYTCKSINYVSEKQNVTVCLIMEVRLQLSEALTTPSDY